MEKNKIKLYVIPHSHFDLEWFWTYEKTIEYIHDIYHDSLLPIMQKDDEYCFCQDQVLVFQPLLTQLDDEYKKLLFKKISEGKFEVVGGMYVQPEMAEPCGESLIRQICFGQRWFEKYIGVRALCAWNIDSFGQINQLPQIFKKSGYKYFVFMRDVPLSQDPANFPTEFFLESPDGSKILTHWLSHTYAVRESSNDEIVLEVGNLKIDKNNIKEIFTDLFRPFSTKPSLQEKTGVMCLLWGEDVYIPKFDSNKIKDLLIKAAWKADIEIYKDDIVISTPSMFFKELETKSTELLTVNTDLNPPFYLLDLRGTYVSRIELKKLNRIAEASLLSLESMAVLTEISEDHFDRKISINIADLQKNIHSMWEDVLFNQFHDIIAGSCSDPVYTEAVRRYNHVIENSKRLAYSLLETGVSDDRNDNENERGIKVFNPTSFTRGGIVSVKLSFNESDRVKWVKVFDQDNKEVSSEIRSTSYFSGNTINEMEIDFLIDNIAGFSTKIYIIKLLSEITLNLAESSEISGCYSDTIENQYYKVKVNSVTGCISSIFDKVRGKELIAAECQSGNEIIAIEEDDPDIEGALKLTGSVYKSSQYKVEQFIVTKDNIMNSIEIMKTFMDFKLTQKITLVDKSPKIDFATTFDRYSGKDLFIKVSFPLNINKEISCNYYETPFSTVKRPDGFFCAQNWAGIFEDNYGVVLINKGTPGYWIEGNRLEMAIMRSFSNSLLYSKLGARKGLKEYEGGKTQTILAREEGRHSFEYALISKSGGFSCFAQEGQAFNYPLYSGILKKAAQLSEETSLIENITGNFLVTSLKYDDESGSIFARGYETDGISTKIRMELGFSVKKGYLTNLLEEQETEIVISEPNTIIFNCRPFEIITLQIYFR